MAISDAQLKLFLGALAVDGGLGLLVSDSEVVLPETRVAIKRIAVDAPSSALAALKDVAEHGTWLRMDIHDANISHELYNALRQIASVQRFDVPDVVSGALLSVRWPKGCAVIVTVPSAVLEAIMIPNFLDLFGPVLRA